MVFECAEPREMILTRGRGIHRLVTFLPAPKHDRSKAGKNRDARDGERECHDYRHVRDAPDGQNDRATEGEQRNYTGDDAQHRAQLLFAGLRVIRIEHPSPSRNPERMNDQLVNLLRCRRQCALALPFVDLVRQVPVQIALALNPVARPANVADVRHRGSHHVRTEIRLHVVDVCRTGDVVIDATTEYCVERLGGGREQSGEKAVERAIKVAFEDERWCEPLIVEDQQAREMKRSNRAKRSGARRGNARRERFQFPIERRATSAINGRYEIDDGVRHVAKMRQASLSGENGTAGKVP